MSDARYERYREALRQGHLSALRGDHPAAVAAYGQAAELAPDRPLPLVGMGNGLRGLGRFADALEAYGRAMDLAPLDEAALAGRAGALVALNRLSQAADTLSDLAEAVDADGRPSEALEVARRAQSLAATRARARAVERLEVRAAQAEAAAARASAQAAAAARERVAPAWPGADILGAVPAVEPRSPAPISAAAGAPMVGEAEALAEAGWRAEARDRFLQAARAHRSAGRLLAAMDACSLALAVAPADPELHLILAELYADRGWTVLAVDKLLLLDRLLDLEGDGRAHASLVALVDARFADEPRLAGLRR